MCLRCRFASIFVIIAVILYIPQVNIFAARNKIKKAYNKKGKNVKGKTVSKNKRKYRRYRRRLPKKDRSLPWNMLIGVSTGMAYTMFDWPDYKAEPIRKVSTNAFYLLSGGFIELNFKEGERYSLRLYSDINAFPLKMGSKEKYLPIEPKAYIVQTTESGEGKYKYIFVVTYTGVVFKFNFPYWHRILRKLNPWIGLGPVFSKIMIAKCDELEWKDEAPDMIDYYLAVGFGLNMNFWKRNRIRNRTLRKFVRKLYATFEMYFRYNLTADDETTPMDNELNITQYDITIRLGVGYKI